MSASVNIRELFSNSTSQFTFPDGTLCTTAELVREGELLAEELRSRGFVFGDRVAVRLPNGRLYVELLLACAVGGFVLVSVNTRYSEAEAVDLIERSGSRLVFDTQRLHGETAAGLAAGIAVPVPAEPAQRDDAPYLVFTTSGTTSKPKMVRHNQRSIAVHGYNAARGFQYGANDVALLVMPFCGTFGLASLTAAVAANASIVVVDRFDAVSLAALIAQHRVTVVNGSDDMFHRLVEAVTTSADLSSVRIGGYARFNTSLDGVVERAAAHGMIITGLYGMSEVQALFAVRNPNLSSSDRALAGGTMVAVDADYRIVDGELQLRGPSMFEGYLAEGGAAIDRDLTAKHFDDGWFRTGDAADAGEGLNADRMFTYQTRLGDVLRLGGFLVAPVDIESVLCAIPGITEAQVVAVDLPAGARPVAFVLSDGSVPFDEAAAIAHCATRLARFKVPVRIECLPEFPVTPSANGNKIQRVKLREQAEALLRPTSG